VIAQARLLGRWLRTEWLLVLLMLLFPLMLVLVPSSPAALAELVDWKTIGALAGLMVLSRALEASGLIDRAGRYVVVRLRGERVLAMAMVVFAAILSAIVTNDVALFVTVPLTLALSRLAPLPVGRFVIFQALAVNAGSAVSPVGNPQNLYLWQLSETGFGAFVMVMLPVCAAMLAILLVLIPFAFARRSVKLGEPPAALPLQRGLMITALCAYPLFLLLVNAGLAVSAAAIVIGFCAIFHRSVLRLVDWPLLLVFVLMFVNLGLLGRLPAIADAVPVAMEMPGGAFALGALISQVMSNVPAAIFLAPFTQDWQALAWGVNVGGFGLAVGSLANLIALRLARLPGLWREFHYWSVPVFALSFVAGIFLMALAP
jgi:Na+/H+ antiporter NhaD/arsenite permease-like protein